MAKYIYPENTAIAFIPVYTYWRMPETANSYATRANHRTDLREYGFTGNSQNLDLRPVSPRREWGAGSLFARCFTGLSRISSWINHAKWWCWLPAMPWPRSPHSTNELGRIIENTSGKLVGTNGFMSGIENKDGGSAIPYVDFEMRNIKQGIGMFYETRRYSSGYAALFSHGHHSLQSHICWKPQKVTRE